MVDWKVKLIEYAEIAYDTGQELRFAVVKRQGLRKWRVYLTELVEHGEDRNE